jgi:hypothetical protein
MGEQVTAVIDREIADDEHAPRVGLRDDVGRPLDGADERARAVSPFVLPEPREPRPGVRERRAARQRAAVREPDGAVVCRRERRRGPDAPDEREESHDGHAA